MYDQIFNYICLCVQWLADCRSLLGRFQHYKVQHAFCEVNRVADAQQYFVILENPPSYVISAFVYSNAIGENFCRLTTSNLAILA